METTIRYVVLGSGVDIERWRRGRGLSRSEICPVMPHNPHHLRGRSLAPDVEVITLPSWRPTERVQAEVDRSLALGRIAYAMS